jgi:hypothetical protein
MENAFSPGPSVATILGALIKPYRSWANLALFVMLKDDMTIMQKRDKMI